MSHADAGLLARDLTDQRALLAGRRVSSVELVTQTLAAVAASRTAVNAHISLDAEAALSAPIAASYMLSLPTITAPAARRRATAGRRGPLGLRPRHDQRRPLRARGGHPLHPGAVLLGRHRQGLLVPQAALSAA